MTLSDHRAAASGVHLRGFDTLACRLREEAVRLRATIVSPSLIAAWTRKP